MKKLYEINIYILMSKKIGFSPLRFNIVSFWAKLFKLSILNVLNFINYFFELLFDKAFSNFITLCSSTVYIEWEHFEYSLKVWK